MAVHWRNFSDRVPSWIKGRKHVFRDRVRIAAEPEWCADSNCDSSAICVLQVTTDKMASYIVCRGRFPTLSPLLRGE